MNDIYFSSLLSVCISPELDICNCFVPNSSNVRFRWIADVGECLLNTESGRSDVSNNRQIQLKATT